MKPITELSGRELDAAVAYEVLGLRPRHSWDRKNGDAQWEIERGSSLVGTLAHYSSDWNAAREVVEKIRGNGFGIQINDFDAEWRALVIDDQAMKSFKGRGATVPEAICRAALAWARRCK